MSHMARLKVDPENRVVMHSHPTYTLAMNYVHGWTRRSSPTPCGRCVPSASWSSPTAWACCPGCSVAPTPSARPRPRRWRSSGWSSGGCTASTAPGKTLDETFGLIETVEKAAQIYMLTAHLPRKNTIQDSQMQELAEFFGVQYRKDFLNL